ESVIIEDEEDVLVGDEDEVLLKANSANKNTSDSGSAAESSNTGDEEELILDGDEEELLVDEEPVETEKVSEQAVSAQGTSDSLTSQATEASENSAAEAATQVYKPAPETQKITKSVESGVLIPSPKDGINLDSISPPQIEKMQSINFAENASKYRSPKIAMLMSFLVPGTGQAYAKCGWRAGVYGAVEVAVIAVGAAFGVKGKNTKKDAKNFANAHYNYDNFNNYYQNLSRHFSDTVINELFSYPEVDTFKALCEKKNEEYYKFLKDVDNPFIQGWDDVTPKFDDDFKVDQSAYPGYTQMTDSSYFVFVGTDSTKAQFGFSKNQEKYRDLMSESNRNYRVAKNVFTLLIVNHIVSAIDAGFTAKAYNDKLLGKQSFWQNINIKEQQVATASGLMNGYVLQVRF
ncbi:MAG: hypothetical protein Q4F84_09310, partial [Fibrobacter sp.]|nr:hypothetical protein [Fibrobacter sp.]